MKREMWLVVALVATSSVAQAALDVEVTHEETNFDVRAVDAQGRAFGINLSDSSRRIWMSTDHARTWSYRGEHPGGSFKQMTALSDGTLIADTESARGFHLSRSVDQGKTWSEVQALGPAARMLTPRSIAETGGTAFFLEYQSKVNTPVPVHLWASEDSGATWYVRHTFYGHRHGHGLKTAPDGALWAFFGDPGLQSGIFRSTDLGESWEALTEGEHACAVDGVFIDGDFVYGQDIPSQPGFPHVSRVGVDGRYTEGERLPGPAYSMMALPDGAGYLMGITRESNGDVYPEGEAGESAHLMASEDGASWHYVDSFPRINASDYARADVYWTLASGEVVLNLRHVRTLSSGRGYRLLRVGQGLPPDPGADPVGEPVSFTDNFDACTSPDSAGGRWDVDGDWYCRAERVRGEAPGLALAQTPDLARTEVRALVQLNGSSGSGVVARAKGDAYYAARLMSDGALELVKVLGAQWTVLATRPRRVGLNTSYRLSLSVNGSSIDVALNELPVLSATDSAPLPAGRAGLLSGSHYRTQYDDFVLWGETQGAAPPDPDPTAPDPTDPDPTDPDPADPDPTDPDPNNPGEPTWPDAYTDDFAFCADDAPLSEMWSVEGRWYCKANRARGESANGLALAQTAELDAMEVGALVQLNGSTGSGVVVRAKAGAYYAARLFKGGLEGGRVELVRVTPGSTTVLGARETPVAFNASRRLLLRVDDGAEATLEVFLDGRPFFVATDSTPLPAGRGGLLSGTNARTQFDDFSVARR